jgi:hypothetical protein
VVVAAVACEQNRLNMDVAGQVGLPREDVEPVDRFNERDEDFIRVIAGGRNGLRESLDGLSVASSGDHDALLDDGAHARRDVHLLRDADLVRHKPDPPPSQIDPFGPGVGPDNRAKWLCG